MIFYFDSESESSLLRLITMQAVARNPWLNKQNLTNGIALALVILGLSLPHEDGNPWLSMGLFAFSGAVTNWLAVYMLFEKVPGLYGSGVIPERFEDFKAGIHQLMMKQFFTPERIEQFLRESNVEGSLLTSGADSLMEQLDTERAFQTMVSVIEESSFAPMLAMVGGPTALAPLKEPFIEKFRELIHEILADPRVQQTVEEHFHKANAAETMTERIEGIVRQRLDELTPERVKEIVEDMIRQHLDWLVVWGGVFGGLIGLLTHFFI